MLIQAMMIFSFQEEVVKGRLISENLGIMLSLLLESQISIFTIRGMLSFLFWQN